MKSEKLEERSEYFFDLIYSILIDTKADNRKKYFSVVSALKQLISHFAALESQYFTSHFARRIFVFDKYNVPAELIRNANKTFYYSTKLKKNKNQFCTTDSVVTAAKTAIYLVELLFEKETPPALKEYVKLSSSLFEENDIKDSDEHLDFINLTVKALGDIITRGTITYSEIFCECEEYGDITLRLYGELLYIYDLVWPGASLNFIDVLFSKDRIIKTSAGSLAVLEPDLLYDVTDISECFTHSGPNPNLYFLKLFSKADPSEAMVVGNIVNSVFDSLLTEPEKDFDDIFFAAVSQRPMQIQFLLSDNFKALDQIRNKVLVHYEALKYITPEFNYDILSIEPSFLSPKYGLQGRLDALMEYSSEPERKDIIELKSGKAPSVGYSVTEGNNKIPTGIWLNHLAQTTCYNLLMDSAFAGRTGSSQILYSSALDRPLRNAINIPKQKRLALEVRNRIARLERKFIECDYSLLNEMNVTRFGPAPSYQENKIAAVRNVFHNMDNVEKEYFKYFLTFNYKEIYAAKSGFGTDNTSGFSSLWKDALKEKENAHSVLSYLIFDPEQSDFNSMYLTFNRNHLTSKISSFRRGDICILYPITGDDESAGLNNQLLKCVIKEIDKHKVVVSLRNKCFNFKMFADNDSWGLEQDHIDSSSKKIFNSIYELISAEKNSRDIILGRKSPTCNESTDISFDYLSEKQNDILNKAIAAEDYYLIQGPPGTGKTSYMLRAIVEASFENSEENILILAYTNRAVDEIASSLRRISPDFPFIRLGNKEATLDTANVISYMAQEMPPYELFKTIDTARVFISTVSFVLTNPEIFSIKYFSTAIIDEASQILEPMLAGILTKVGKFIMIGDEKQLPAIILQGNNAAIPELLQQELGLISYNMSLFERLLRICKARGDYHAFGMLDSQARMHEDIQFLANELFYGGALKIFSENVRQIECYTPFLNGDIKEHDLLDSLLSSGRVLWFETLTEFEPKINRSEAHLAATIIKKFKSRIVDKKNGFTLGAIAPFRAQCNEISKLLTKTISDKVMVDTVERYQGSEKDIIIISFAVNSLYQMRSVSSLTEIDDTLVDRKLNVAITRAKEQLIMIGAPTLLSTNPIFANLIDLVKSKGGFIPYDKWHDKL